MPQDPPLIRIVRPSAAPDGTGADQKRGRTPTGPSAVEWPAVMQRLREYAAARPRPAAEQPCELCGAPAGPEHGHVVNLAARTLLCVCRPCYLLFTHDGAGGSRFRAVPARYRLVPGFEAGVDDWDALQVPVGLAFVFRNSATGCLAAFYPGPAGATESELPLEAWDALVRTVPSLSTLAADVEALLVRRTETGAVALIAPIDACYELVGRIRRAWRGLHGGDAVGREIDAFFARAAERARADGSR